MKKKIMLAVLSLATSLVSFWLVCFCILHKTVSESNGFVVSQFGGDLKTDARGNIVSDWGTNRSADVVVAASTSAGLAKSRGCLSDTLPSLDLFHFYPTLRFRGTSSYQAFIGGRGGGLLVSVSDGSQKGFVEIGGIEWAINSSDWVAKLDGLMWNCGIPKK